MASLAAAVIALAVLVVGVTAYYATRASLYNEVDDELVDVAGYMVGPIASDISGMGGLNSSALRAANVNIVLVKADHSIVRMQDAPVSIQPGAAEIAVARLGFGKSTRTVTLGPGNEPYRLVAVPLESEDNGSYALVLARPLGPLMETLGQLRAIMIALGVTFIVIGAAAGHRLGSAVMRPLRQLSDAVAHVTETDDLAPIGSTRPDELGDLSRSFDTMMHSLASSRHRQQRLIADAGHELRTPLTSMRTNVELLVADEKTGMLPSGARAEILGDVADQLGEFSSLVGDLVQLSRDDVVTPSLEPLDFANVVNQAVTRAKRRGNGLEFDVVTQPYYVVGEPDTLERAVTNLLDNAVKFSPEHGTVHVRLVAGTLTVSDEGPGIAEEDLPHIFDRFFRSNKARNTPGTGLGLSIVAHTIQAHGGQVSAGNVPGAGALFTVTLPPAPPGALDEGGYS
ncbi:sensor histidine kinase [Propionibacterium cyclohexanicum]|uniref:sensor histidine kinase n=1 Tax=Propionibacterium cyclohexanicum TaxID=64702 RepID=UPI001FE060E6|nr:HAMP domain-containing sensor histidine kinase [Propionibacterium cyclohexanicum]